VTVISVLEPIGAKIRLILVPDFSKTKAIVLVNLKTLDTKQISFGPTQI
jgi:hypothetical protein